MPQTHAPPTALPAPAEKAAHVRRMFSSIAPRYDLLNHVLSLNVDRLWRKRAVNRLGWERAPEGTYLDNCAGTLDLAVELAKRKAFRGRVVGSDFTYAMLENGVGAGKTRGAPIGPACADALALPFAGRGVRRGHGGLRGAQPGGPGRGAARDGARAEARRPAGDPGVHHAGVAAVPRPVLLLLPEGAADGGADGVEALVRLHLPAGVGAELSRRRRSWRGGWRRPASAG